MRPPYLKNKKKRKAKKGASGKVCHPSSLAVVGRVGSVEVKQEGRSQPYLSTGLIAQQNVYLRVNLEHMHRIELLVFQEDIGSRQGFPESQSKDRKAEQFSRMGKKGGS